MSHGHQHARSPGKHSNDVQGGGHNSHSNHSSVSAQTHTNSDNEKSYHFIKVKANYGEDHVDQDAHTNTHTHTHSHTYTGVREGFNDDDDAYGDGFALHNEHHTHAPRHKPTKGELYASQAKKMGGIVVYDDEITELEMERRGMQKSDKVTFTFGGGDEGRLITCECNRYISPSFLPSMLPSIHPLFL